MRDESYFSIIFGEGTDAVDIGKLLDAVTKVERNAGAGQEHTYSAGTGRFGKTWVSGRRSSYDITIEGQKTGSPAELLSLRTNWLGLLIVLMGQRNYSLMIRTVSITSL